MAHPIWPLYDLEVRTPRLVLRYVDDELAAELALLAARGIHDPGSMPFGVPWTDAESPHLERGAMQYHWRCRAELRPESWDLNFAVLHQGRVVGSTGLVARDFPVLREFATGSWLGRAHQGQGIGREMRAACLHLGFAGLGARRATSVAWADNGPSNAVSLRLGYLEAGRAWARRRDEEAEQIRYLMTRSAWEQRRRDDIELVGVEPCRALLGAW
jgi:RimJ/RimL family protein N-acetyltransferase